MPNHSDPVEPESGAKFGPLFGYDDEVKQAIASDSLVVPRWVELKDGHLCYQYWSRQRSRDTEPAEEAKVDYDMKRVAMIGPMLKNPSPRLLDGFLQLADADEDRILTYARRWGVLDVCAHGYPTSRFVAQSLGGWSHGEVTPCAPLAWRGLKSSTYQHAGRERVEIWRAWSRRARSLMRIAAETSSERPGALEDWVEVYGADANRHWEGRRLILNNSDYPPYMLDRQTLYAYLNLWVALGEIGPRIVSRDGRPGVIRFSGSEGGKLFGMLGLQMLVRACGLRGMALCASCGELYRPKRKPDPEKQNFCRDCGHDAAVKQAKKRLTEKKRSARRMFEAGSSVEEIAARLSSKRATVQGWLPRKKRTMK